MVEKVVKPTLNVVVDFARYQTARANANVAVAVEPSGRFKLSETPTPLVFAKAISPAAMTCRHCGAALLEGENEDDCSGALVTSRRFYAE